MELILQAQPDRSGTLEFGGHTGAINRNTVQIRRMWENTVGAELASALLGDWESCWQQGGGQLRPYASGATSLHNVLDDTTLI